MFITLQRLTIVPVHLVKMEQLVISFLGNITVPVLTVVRESIVKQVRNKENFDKGLVWNFPLSLVIC